jgi:hypothetical protein
MATSPETLNEIINQQAETNKQNLANLLLDLRFIDKLAVIAQYSKQSHIVSSFAIYKRGEDFIFSEPVCPMLNENGCFACKNPDLPSWVEPSIRQDDLRNDELICENPGQQLIGLFHTHIQHNSHCDKEDPEAFCMPTVTDLNEWHKNGILANSVTGILACQDNQQSLALCRAKRSINHTPMWAMYGDGRYLPAKALKQAMEYEGVTVSSITLGSDILTYQSQVLETVSKLV